MSEEKNCKDIVIQKYKDSVNLYLRNGCTEFHSGLTIGIERILKRLNVTPSEIVRLYNGIWQQWHDEVKNDSKVKKHFRIETTEISDLSKPIYEGCNCDECEARRKEIRGHLQK